METLTFDAERNLSHAYIVVSQSEEARNQMALTIASAAVCSGIGGVRPCGICRDCRKVKAGVHPDVIQVSRETDDKGKQKREIRVDQIREMTGQAQIMPNEAAGKAFIIRDAETMNPNAQNALLKLLEEPPKAVVLILSSEAPAMLLPTIRSRCVELRVNEEAPDMPEELMEEVMVYLKQVASGQRSDLLLWCNEKAAHTDIAGTLVFVNAVKTVLTDCLCDRNPVLKLNKLQCWELVELMERCENLLMVNTGIKHIFGLLAVKSIGGNAPVEMRKS